MGPNDKEESLSKMNPHSNPSLSVKSEPLSPSKVCRGSPVKSKPKGPAVSRSKILNMDLTGWDEASWIMINKELKKNNQKLSVQTNVTETQDILDTIEISRPAVVLLQTFASQVS